jgi:hypothetical protein
VRETLEAVVVVEEVSACTEEINHQAAMLTSKRSFSMAIVRKESQALTFTPCKQEKE